MQTVEEGRVLRNDADRLAQVAVGALARYSAWRNRATIQWRGLIGWSDLVGRILTVIDDGAESTDINAPITGMEWNASSDGKNVTTRLHTGFAK